MQSRSRRSISSGQFKSAKSPAQRDAERARGREEAEPDVAAAMWRVKHDRVGPGDISTLQRSLGNKGAGQLLQRYGVRPGSDTGTIRRHSIPEGRQGVGNEDDEIVAQRTIQRSPAFGATAHRERRSPWGNGSRDVVRRKGGKGGGGAAVKDPAAAKGGASKAGLKEDEASKKQAEKEYADYVAAGPYKIPNYVPDTVDNFGKFDAIYDPAGKTLTADMRIKFTFPDMPLPEKADTLAEIMNKATIAAIHVTWIANFLTQVTAGWSGKFNFRNIRAPQSIWGKLNPISVRVKVAPVDTNQHYIMKAFLKKAGTANVRSNTAAKDPSTVTFFKGDLDPSKQSFTGSKQTGPDEIARLTRNLPKIRFANGSSSVDAKYIPDLKYVADYLRQINVPKFDITVIGRANKTGNEPANLKISQARADSVAAKLKEFGVTNHNVTAKGDGSNGATPDGQWRKVDFGVGVPKGFTNVQDTTLHEFGHMLGLDDEYVRGGGDTRTNTTQQKWMQKMLGTKDHGKGNENKLADDVTKVDPLSSASVMESGSEVRSYHYVTLWQALYDSAALGAKQPTPPFTFADWKVG